MAKISKLLTFFIAFIFQASIINSLQIYLSLKPNLPKCIKERISKDTLVVGKFKTHEKESVVSIFIYDIDVNEKKINSLDKLPIFEAIDEHDIKTAFTTFYSGSYSFCAYNKSNKVVDIYFEIKHGVEARDYTKIAKADHLNEATIFLKQILNSMKTFQSNLKRIKISEEKEKKSSEKLNDTLMWFSILTIIIIIIAALTQDFYYKRFFTSKKII
ncbi:transmembrane protein Tmp21 precursor [Plasmodium yoelii]|uniref:Transmembrane emp24 domain-containing protein n=3 Tax=Plasmodium yoelii TaxID=5861 RepID=A0AAE9X1D5_PLAYO|nr:transmembrane protein Tmp21 precursor [Plasmodium yoelii]EAA18629.1 transmembrane protein tmp21 precursor [Plasmodium yoelii yoelii]WBY60259.1 transmembrane emp24 domain-containing protein [Plasmodium yoelii yoelii]CDU20147.1 transmembrane protein Tmp21 homologue, putative [Plasmodium yoelii]VTZ80905.1 transmembrane emp24 domain-containing protein, putative [Plasmodium yoelii]|eukprot:XP_727064.1 transmembrane protein Tmp21 precursor [Plasmodium yoelii]